MKDNTPAAAVPDVCSPADVARIFGVDPKTVTRWAKAGRLASIRTAGGHRRYAGSDVRALLGAPPPPRPAPRVRHPATSASLAAGGQGVIALRGTPVAGDADPASGLLILGHTGHGTPVTITARSLEWLDDLETAARETRSAITAAGQPVTR